MTAGRRQIATVLVSQTIVPQLKLLDEWPPSISEEERQMAEDYFNPDPQTPPVFVTYADPAMTKNWRVKSQRQWGEHDAAVWAELGRLRVSRWMQWDCYGG